tara:strand:+ start:150 stop:566 length:417 start_codon:yes stop_codon:yes gene_type:complete
MTPTIENSIKEMIASAMEQQVVALAEKYKFDVEEARDHMKICDIKFVKGRAVSPKKETKKDKKTNNDTPKEKKAMTGYMLFSKEHREEVTEKAKSTLKEGEKYQASGTVKTLGAMWTALSKEEQVKWNEKAHAAKDEK